jgi:hypothetical protein
MNRWVLRVSAYTALMTDDYPPFRLDMGGSEPSTFAVTPTSFRPAAAAAGPAWSTGPIVTLVIGSLLLVGGVGAAVGGSAVLAADRGGRDAAGFLNTPTQTFTGSGYALVFDPLELRTAAASQNVDALVGDVRLNATGAAQGAGVFVGIGPADAVDGYLASVERARVVGFRTDNAATQQQLAGGAPATPPGQRTFWVASAAGPGAQQLHSGHAVDQHPREHLDQGVPVLGLLGPHKGLGAVVLGVDVPDHLKPDPGREPPE